MKIAKTVRFVVPLTFFVVGLPLFVMMHIYGVVESSWLRKNSQA